MDAAVEHLLAGDPGDSGESAERRAFLAWETIARAVSSRAEQGPVLLVLEDLHWADTATLRALRRLVTSTAPGQRLVVLLTRRPWPEPTGALAELGEELARRQALRVDLGGLSLEEAGALVREVAGTQVTAEVIAQWHARSEGNPFFLVELARLRVTDTDVAPVPATVRDVVVRRLEPLPEETRELLLLASVLGRRCSLDVLAAIAGQPVDTTEDLLAPARDAGLVHEPEVGVLAFTHALTRDAVATTTTPSRLARLHARVAHALSDDAGPAGVSGVTGLIGPEERVAELARHWLAAGPSHVSRAWRAASAAADQARRACSWVEAEQLVSAAIEAHRRDPLGTAAERIDLLLARAHDCRPNAEWDQVLPCAIEAVALARREQDVARHSPRRISYGEVEFKDFLLEACSTPAAISLWVEPRKISRSGTKSRAKRLIASLPTVLPALWRHRKVASSVVKLCQLVNETFECAGYAPRGIRLPDRWNPLAKIVTSGPRRLKSLAKIRPAFGGVQTGGNSSAVVDGAAATLVASGELARKP